MSFQMSLMIMVQNLVFSTVGTHKEHNDCSDYFYGANSSLRFYQLTHQFCSFRKLSSMLGGKSYWKLYVYFMQVQKGFLCYSWLKPMHSDQYALKIKLLKMQLSRSNYGKISTYFEFKFIKQTSKSLRKLLIYVYLLTCNLLYELGVFLSFVT